MKTFKDRFAFWLIAALLFSAAQRHALAGSVTWSSKPILL